MLRVSADGHIDNVVLRFRNDDRGFVRIDAGGITVPFFPRPKWTVSPSGARVGVLTTHMDAPDPYMLVHVADDRGNAIVDRSFPFVPHPVPDGVRDSVIHAYASLVSDTTVSRDIESALRGAVPAVYPPATDILIGTDNRIWIGMQPGDEGTRWRVLSPYGEPQGEVLLPPRVRLRSAGADYLLATERDEFDVESIVRYRIGQAL